MRLSKVNWPVVNTVLLIVVVVIIAVHFLKKENFSYPIPVVDYSNSVSDFSEKNHQKEVQYFNDSHHADGGAQTGYSEYMRMYAGGMKDRDLKWKPLNHVGVTALQQLRKIIVQDLNYDSGSGDVTYTEQFKKKYCKVLSLADTYFKSYETQKEELRMPGKHGWTPVKDNKEDRKDYLKQLIMKIINHRVVGLEFYSVDGWEKFLKEKTDIRCR